MTQQSESHSQTTTTKDITYLNKVTELHITKGNKDLN